MRRGALAALALVCGLLFVSALAEERRSLLQTSAPSTCPSQRSFPQDGTLSSVGLSARITDFVWAGGDFDQDQFVFALTQGPGESAGHLYRSANYGKSGSWEDMTSQMAGSVSTASNDVGVQAVLVHKLHQEHIFFQGGGTSHWSSVDFGATVTRLDTPAGTMGRDSTLKLHPTQADWILAKVKRPACSISTDNPSCAYDLFVSQNFGRNWLNLTGTTTNGVAAFWDFDWGATINRVNKPKLPDETILATAYPDGATLKGLYPGWDPAISLFRSDDFFRTKPTTLVPCGNQFEIIDTQVFVAVPQNCPTNPDGTPRTVANTTLRNGQTAVALFVSGDEGDSYQEGCVPVSMLDEGYNVVATHDGKSAFLLVDHSEENSIESRAPISNLYASGFAEANNATLFGLSQRRVFRRGYTSDFARVEGLPGTYLSNQLDGRIFTDPSLMPAPYNNFVKTKISYSGGAEWHDLPVPKHFTFYGCNTCKNPQNCSLQLHGPSSWHYGIDSRPSYYSTKSAPGLIAATGNTGTYLKIGVNEPACTWLSNDGGYTWRDVANFAGIYEFGDYGAVIAMAQHLTEGPTDIVYFSVDQGHCWNKVQLSEALDIQNIRSAPSGRGDTFLVHGLACTKKAGQTLNCTHEDPNIVPAGILYTFDVSDLMGSTLPKCTASDYENWSPPTPDLCLLGTNYTFTRRKAGSVCMNDADFSVTNTSTPCTCTPRDVECEYGYERSNNGDGTACIPTPGFNVNSCPAIQDKLYYQSASHYRLVAGDTCSDLGAIISDTNGLGIYSASYFKRVTSGLNNAAIIGIALGSLVVVLLAVGAAIFVVRRRAAAYQEVATGEALAGGEEGKEEGQLLPGAAAGAAGRRAAQARPGYDL